MRWHHAVLIVAIERWSWSMNVLVAVKIHSRLTRRLSRSHVIMHALLKMEWQLMLVCDLWDSVRWIRWRHGLYWEVMCFKCLSICRTHRRIFLFIVRELSEDRRSVISGLDAPSCLPILSLAWLECFDMLQSVELALDGRTFRLRKWLPFQQRTGNWGGSSGIESRSRA